MGDVEILHRLFTNAAEEGSWERARARVVPLDDHDASSVLEPDVLEALDDLLKKTSSATTRTAWVVRRFAGRGAQTYACVIASYPDLVVAAEKRSGVLNHARLVPVDAPSFDAAALIETALEFPLGEVSAAAPDGRLRKYLEVLSGEAPVLVRPAAISELQALPTAALIDVLIGCLAGHARREGLRIAMRDAGPVTVARAWAALPSALQRTSSWGFEVSESCPVDVVFSPDDGAAATAAGSAALVDTVQQYVRLLREAPATIDAMIVNPDIADANKLAAAVRRSALAPQLSSIDASGKGEMSKKEKAAKPAPQREREGDVWEPLDADVRAEMNRQYEAMNASLRIAVDERLAAFEARLASQSLVGPSPARNARRGSRLAAYAGLAVLAIAIVGGLWYFTRPKPRPQQNVPVQNQQDAASQTPEPAPVTTSIPAAVTPVQEAVSRAEKSGKWADEWKAILESDSAFASSVINDLADRGAVPSAVREKLIRFATRIENKEDLRSDGRQSLRLLLVECIAEEVAPRDVTIDGNLADAARILDDLRNRYGVRSAEKDLTQMTLQSEIILRWMASQER